MKSASTSIFSRTSGATAFVSSACSAVGAVAGWCAVSASSTAAARACGPSAATFSTAAGSP